MQVNFRLFLLVLSIPLFMGCRSVAHEVKTQEQVTPSKPVAKTESFAIHAVPRSVLAEQTYYARCGNEVKSMASILEPIANNMSKQKIPYAQSPSNEWRDCSGNFLRLSSYVAGAC